MDKALRIRALIACLVLVAGLSALSVRLLTLQFWDRKVSEGLSISNFQLHKKLPASRGLIVDRNNEPLAQNRPFARLVADPRHLKHFASTKKAVVHHFARQAPDWSVIDAETKKKRLRKIERDIINPMEHSRVMREHLVLASEILGRELQMPAGEILAKVEAGKNYVILEKDIRESDARDLEDVLERNFIQGFSFERYKKRHYPMSNIAPHLIGFGDSEGRPKAGIEKACDEYLRGQDGERTLKRDANGSVRLTESASVNPARLGKHVKLSLDIGIQSIVEEELDRVCERYEPKRASVVLVDPHNGDILAIANRPHYDLNLRENVSAAWAGFAWQGIYEAGSVMKIVGMAAALDAGKATRESTVHCTTVRRPGGVRIRNHYCYGDNSFDVVLAKSSNPGVYLFSEMVGQQEFYSYLRGFGFGQKTGFCLPGEVSGYIAPSKNPQNFASATFGYGVTVTPIQLAMAYSAIANGGKLLEPRLVKSVISNSGIELHTTPVKVVRRVISEQASLDMRGALEQVGLIGTARRLKIPGHRFGGKTGTAHISFPGKGYDTSRYSLSFAGMVPALEPKFVCVVTVFDPQKIGEDERIGGGTVAGPVFASIASRVAPRLNIVPTEPIIEPEVITAK